MENDGKVSSGYFTVALLSAFFYPLQGFFNFFIFIRPRYVELSRQHPRETKLEILGRIFHREQTSGRKKAADSGGTAGTADEPSSLNFDAPSRFSRKSGLRMSSWFMGSGRLLRPSKLQDAVNQGEQAPECCPQDVCIDDTKDDGEKSEVGVEKRNGFEYLDLSESLHHDGEHGPLPALFLDDIEIDSSNSGKEPGPAKSAAALVVQQESPNYVRKSNLLLELGEGSTSTSVISDQHAIAKDIENA
jgi:hypothetical protein